MFYDHFSAHSHKQVITWVTPWYGFYQPVTHIILLTRLWYNMCRSLIKPISMCNPRHNLLVFLNKFQPLTGKYNLLLMITKV